MAPRLLRVYSWAHPRKVSEHVGFRSAVPYPFSSFVAWDPVTASGGGAFGELGR